MKSLGLTRLYSPKQLVERIHRNAKDYCNFYLKMHDSKGQGIPFTFDDPMYGYDKERFVKKLKAAITKYYKLKDGYKLYFNEDSVFTVTINILPLIE